MESTNGLYAALAAAQAEMQNPSFDSQNPHFRSKFASLAAVRNAVVPVLARHGIAVLQNLTTTDNGIGCETILTHASGETLRLGPLAMPATKADAQGFGSAATYARRYSLMAVAGVVGDDDDDANSATGKPAAPERYDSSRVQNAIKAARAALDADVEEADKAKLVRDWHAKANKDNEFYQAVWSEMGSKERSAIKAYLAQTTKPEMLANGRAA